MWGLFLTEGSLSDSDKSSIKGRFSALLLFMQRACSILRRWAGVTILNLKVWGSILSSGGVLVALVADLETFTGFGTCLLFDVLFCLPPLGFGRVLASTGGGSEPFPVKVGMFVNYAEFDFGCVKIFP